MATDKKFAPNIDNSNLVVYPNGRIQDNTGSGNGTPVNNYVYSDLHEMKDKLMRLYGIDFNGLPDNETNGFQTIDALRALASKNDFILDLTDNSGVLNVNVKLNFMLQKESVLCVSGVDLGSQTQIRGIDGNTYSVTYVGTFKTGEYVRLIRTASGVTLIREVDAVNLDLATGEFGYLKKANQTEENAGTIDNKATTPLVNKVAFTKRVNGTDSPSYLATALQNGIYPKEHFAIVAGLGAPALRNIGWLSGVNVDSGSPGTLYPISGDITVATIISSSGGRQVIRCTMANAMTNTDYEVQTSIESQGSFTSDVEIQPIVFKPISTTQFEIALRETTGATQSLKIHCRIIQL